MYSGDPSHFHEWQFRTLLRVELCKKKMEQKAKEKAKEASRSPATSPASGEISRLMRQDQEMLELLLLRYHPKPHQVSKRSVGLLHLVVKETMTCLMSPLTWSWSQRSWKGSGEMHFSWPRTWD